MNIILRLTVLMMSPYLLVIYWRNSFRQVDDIHAHYDLNFAEEA